MTYIIYHIYQYFLIFNHFYFVASVLMINLSKWYLILLFPISSLAICGLWSRQIQEAKSKIASHRMQSIQIISNFPFFLGQ